MGYQGSFKILMITLIFSKKLGGYKIMSHTVYQRSYVSFSVQKVTYLCTHQTSKMIICGPKIGMFFIYANQSVSKLLMAVEKFQQLTFSSMENISGQKIPTILNSTVTPISMILIWSQKTKLITKISPNISKANVINY